MRLCNGISLLFKGRGYRVRVELYFFKEILHKIFVLDLPHTLTPSSPLADVNGRIIFRPRWPNSIVVSNSVAYSLSREKLKEVMNPNWLRAHKRRSNIMKINSKNPDLVFVPVLSSPPNLTADDVASTYLAEDMGETDDDLHELFTYENPVTAGPSRLGKGRGKMAALTFGNNPFDEVEDTENSTPELNQSRPTIILAQAAAPLKPTDKEKQQRKRGGAFLVPGGGKGDTSKKGKQNAGTFSSGVAELYCRLASMNFKEKDVKMWNDRDRDEASLNLRRALGESFLHGMTYLNTLEGEHASLERSLKTTKDAADYY
ncbi:hypothetical protein POM88_013053 [Heracleum sosnowskyi]|uniref:Uncharacterized protein n=1 Tax=Heracleum sosnowskyi TaxID=360622 RepID=A0AAD8IXP1_9APIA|nr:hypothetical protein POM88_013053 [Heracleum sosnowskyi]